MGFKFEIGDFVVQKNLKEMWKAECHLALALKKMPLRTTWVCTVSSRRLEECPGGVQYHYVVRPWNGTQHEVDAARWINEVELEKWRSGA